MSGPTCPTRYELEVECDVGYAGMEPNPSGEWVRFSDAERMREALEEIDLQTGEPWVRKLARAALNPEDK